MKLTDCCLIYGCSSDTTERLEVFLPEVLLLQPSCHEPLLILGKEALLIVELLGFNEPLLTTG